MSSKKSVNLYSRIVDNIIDVPYVFKDGFNYLCLDCKEFPFSIYTHDEEDDGLYSQLVSLTESGLFIFDIKSTGVRLTQYQYSDIILMKKSNNTDNATIILEGYFNRRLFQSKIEFDTSQGYIFDILLNNIRLKGNLPETNSDENAYGFLKLGFLKNLNPRIYDLAVQCQMPNRSIKNIVFQKKLLIRKLKILKKAVIMSHVVILTEDEIIVIEEGRKKSKEPGLNFGGCWYFIPINNIISIDISSNDNFLLWFTLKLKGDEDVKFIFENGLKHELEKFVEAAHYMYQMK